MTYCENCGTPLGDRDAACPKCGRSMRKYCRYCGSLTELQAVVCPRCGRQIGELQSAPRIVIRNMAGGCPGRWLNKWTALLLCFFLGFFGAHKFYEGKTGMGILYLLTAGLLGIGAFIDFISILFKPNPYFVPYR